MAWIKCKRPSMRKFYNREIMGDAAPLVFGRTHKAQVAGRVGEALIEAYPDAFEWVDTKKEEKGEEVDE